MLLLRNLNLLLSMLPSQRELYTGNECGSGCGCGLDCMNRVSQKGILVALKIVRDEKKSWCLFVDQFIKKGQFICEYAEFSCQICRQAMTRPVTTPCAHNFCKACIVAKFAGMTLFKERSRGGRTLRAKKNIMKCPCCPTDISDFLQNPQVNTEIMEVIKKLKKKDEPVDATSKECEGAEENEEELEQPKKKAKMVV